MDEKQDIHFTSREIDILSCIISGRNTQAIALLLAISSRTVESHTRNIMIKVGCNSRERLINFIEKSGYFPNLKEHYLHLLIQDNFLKRLREIRKLFTSNSHKYFICYEPHQSLKSLSSFLHQSLKEIGLIVKIKSTLPLQRDFSFTAHKRIFLLLKEEYHNLVPILTLKGPSEQYFILNHIEDQNLIEIAININLDSVANLEEKKDLFYKTNFDLCGLIFAILQKLIPHEEGMIDKQKKEFEQYVRLVCSPLVEPSYLQIKKTTEPPSKQSILENINLRFKWKNYTFVKLGFITLLFFFIGVLSFKDHLFLKTKRLTPFKVIHSSINSYSNPKLLHRSDLLNQIQKTLSSTAGINSLVLTGIAGCGKTTLAHQYASQQEAKIIWEIDAETPQKIFNSFAQLAQTLIRTEEERKTYQAIEEIKDYAYKEQKMIQWVRDLLKAYEGWLMIFDNVGKFSDIQKYFPTSIQGWSPGKVIVISRDDNLHHNTSIQHALRITELTLLEAQDLFINIMAKKLPSVLSVSQRKEIDNFLIKLPLFPLDISIAAYYIKATGISYQDYLNRLKYQSKDFKINQEYLLKENMGYSITRADIIQLTIDIIREENKVFDKLLLLVSILDHKSIPRFLLDNYQKEEIIDRFLYKMRQFSLISEQKMDPFINKPTFMFHKSIQEIILMNIHQHLNLKELQGFYTTTIQNFSIFSKKAIEEESYKLAHLLIPHLESIRQHQSLFRENSLVPLEVVLGGLYSFSGHYLKAESLLTALLKDKTKFSTLNKKQHAEILQYLGMTYNHKGEYQKARNVMEESLALYKQYISPDHHGTSRVMLYLSHIHRGLGNYEYAKELLEKAIALQQKHFPEKRAPLASALKCLGMIYRSLGEYSKAQTFLMKSIRYYQETGNERGTAGALVILGDVYRELGAYQKATEQLEKALKIYRDFYPSNHTHIAWAVGYLGSVYHEQGDYIKALDLFKEGLKIYKETPNHSGIAWSYTHLANTYQALGDLERARDLLKESITLHEKYAPDNKSSRAWALGNLGRVYRAYGQYEQAEMLLNQSLDLYQKSLQRPHIYIAWVLLNLGEVFKDRKDYAKARELLEQSKKIYIEQYGEKHIEVARVFISLSDLYLAEGNINKAEELLKQSIILSSRHPDHYIALKNLAQLYLKKSEQATDSVSADRYKKLSQQFFQKAWQSAQRYLPSDCRLLKNIEIYLK